MAPTFQPVPERHDEFDAHLLRACIQGPMYDGIALQLRDTHRYYINPWLVPWYMRPKCERTDFTIHDFAEDFRTRFERVLEDVLPLHPSGPTLRDLPRAPTFLRYLSHTIVQHAAALHAQRIDQERMLFLIRRDLRAVFPQHGGAYFVESPAHPFWKDGTELRQNDGETSEASPVVRCAKRVPTIVEKHIARFLAGPAPNVEGSDGVIGELIARAQPHLLSLDTGKCALHALELRRKLCGLLRGKEHFSAANRRQAVEWIASAWEETRPPASTEQLSRIDRWSDPVADVLARHFGEEILADRASFAQKQFLLEQMSIQCALEAHGDDKRRAQADMDRIFDVWQEAMLRHRLSLCDAPTLGLAFLAGNACSSEPQDFIAHLGIDQ